MPFSMRNFPRGQSSIQRPYDPNEDDLVEHTASVKSHNGHGSAYVAASSIQFHSKFPTIIQTTDPSQPLTCIVVIELPGKCPPGSVPGPRVIETSPVVKPLVAAESQILSNSGSPRPNSPPHCAGRIGKMLGGCW